MVVTFTDDVDLSGRGKRVHSIKLQAAAASTVRIREGSVTGAIKWEHIFAAAGEHNEQWPSPLFLYNPFIEVTVALTSGSIDLH